MDPSQINLSDTLEQDESKGKLQNPLNVKDQQVSLTIRLLTHYALNQRVALERVMEDGEVALDNNLVENAIRPTAVGKRNWLFMGTKVSGQRSAVMYTLIQSCRIIGVEPSEYLRDVLENIPKLTNQQFTDWPPRNWAIRKGLVKAKSKAA